MVAHTAALRKRSGLTLAELVVVLVILAALAMLLVPRLGFVKGQADHAQAASGAAEVMSNLELYRTSTGFYPLRMDSLIETGGTNKLSTLWFHSPDTGPGQWFNVEDLASGGRSSLVHAFGTDPVAGGMTVMDHDPAAADPSSSGTVTRVLTSASANVAVVDPTTSGGLRIAQAAGYPTAAHIPSNIKLVAFGIGPRCGAIGKTMASTPRHSGASPNHYGRFIAIFAVSTNSSRAAELRTVVDSRRTSIDSRVNSFMNSAPTHE